MGVSDGESDRMHTNSTIETTPTCQKFLKSPSTLTLTIPILNSPIIPTLPVMPLPHPVSDFPIDIPALKILPGILINKMATFRKCSQICILYNRIFELLKIALLINCILFEI